MREAILEQNHDMASNALRVLAVAYRPLRRRPGQRRRRKPSRRI